MHIHRSATINVLSHENLDQRYVGKGLAPISRVRARFPQLPSLRLMAPSQVAHACPLLGLNLISSSRSISGITEFIVETEERSS